MWGNFPIRCFTCGKCVSKDAIKYQECVNKGEVPQEVLDQLRYNRECCRRMFLTHVDHTDILLLYGK